MYCQLDHVKQILDIAAAVRNSLAQKFPGAHTQKGLGQRASSVAYGLLLLFDYDVFIQQGIIGTVDKNYEHYWIDVYMDGEPFILDTTLTQFERELGQKIPDVVFMPRDEAGETYGYARGQDVDWRPGDCEPRVWKEVLKTLKIDQPLDEILMEIENR